MNTKKSRTAAAVAVPFYCRPGLVLGAMALAVVVAFGANAATSPSGDVEVVDVPSSSCPSGLMTGWECRTQAAINAATK